MKKYFLALVVVFIVSRFFVFGQMYHQDEYKWGMIVNPVFGLNLTSDHPPLVGLLYKATGELFGFASLRLLPISASILLLILVFFLAHRLYGKKAAWWTVLILTISSYFFIASTQVDIDGALLPLATLLLFFAYYRIDWRDFRSRQSKIWSAVFVGALVLGLLIKLSFIIPIGVLATEYFLSYRKDKRFIFFPGVLVLSSILIFTVVAFGLESIFHIARPSQFLSHATDFALFNFGARNYFEILFLILKSVVLASPILIFPLFYVFSKTHRAKFRVWFIYLFYNFLFYFVIFDFSNRTLERYDMFLIIPTAIISGALLSEWFSNMDFKSKKADLVWGAAILGLALSFLPLFIKMVVLPLNPKSAYLGMIKHLNLNFLIPITGGSGPIGFYVSALYVFTAFALSLIAFVMYYYKKHTDLAGIFLVTFVVVALSYNLVIDSEFVGGFLYGNVDKIARETTSEVLNNPSINQVITYNDVAGYELNLAGKYYKRFYTDPMFADTNVGKFSSYQGYYMVLNFPLINPYSVYSKYFETCQKVFSKTDKKVTGYIFDCRRADASIFKN